MRVHFEKSRSKELQICIVRQTLTREIKELNMEWFGNLTRLGENRNTQESLFRELRKFGKPRQKDNININFK